MKKIFTKIIALCLIVVISIVGLPTVTMGANQVNVSIDVSNHRAHWEEWCSVIESEPIGYIIVGCIDEYGRRSDKLIDVFSVEGDIVDLSFLMYANPKKFVIEFYCADNITLTFLDKVYKLFEYDSSEFSLTVSDIGNKKFTQDDVKDISEQTFKIYDLGNLIKAHTEIYSAMYIWDLYEEESWKTDKVKIEFRYADTKEIIDTSDKYLHDASVAFNFKSVEYGEQFERAKNGIVYLEAFYFPLNYFVATWESAFSDGEKYICKSTSNLTASAGDTIVIYMSTTDNQGSVTKIVTSAASKNYGAHNTSVTIDGKIRNKSKELVGYIDEYLSLVNGKSHKKSINSNIDEETLQKQAKSIMNVSLKDKFYIVPPNTEMEYALCYAFAKVFNNQTNEKIDLGNINLDKSIEEIALNLTNKLIANFGEVNQTVVCGNCKVNISLTMFGKAFMGSYSIYNKKGSLVYGPSIVSSSQSATKTTLKAYFTALSDLVNDMLKTAMASIFTELSDVTELTSFRENALNSTVKNAFSILENNGFGKVKDLLIASKEIYVGIKDIASATSELTVSNIINTEKKTMELYKIVYNNKFSSSKANETAAKEIISKMEAARKELYNLLYNKLYGTEKDETSTLTRIGNWIKLKILCPVDVDVYDSEGVLIGYVDTMGRHNDYIYHTEEIYIETQGDEKFIYYPVDETINLKFYGTNDGEMTYSIELIVDDISVDRLNYYNVPIKKGHEYVQVIEGNIDLFDVKNCLSLFGDTEIYADEYLSVDDETAHIRVLYSSTEGGSVSGDMYYPKGECAILYAYPKEGYIFKGWYEEGEKISEDEIYRFAAIEDIVLEARFEKKEVLDNGEEIIPILDRILLSENELNLKMGEQIDLCYIAIPSTSNVDLIWKSSNPSIVSVDENGCVTALMEGATIITVDDVNTNVSAQCRVVVGVDNSCVSLGHKFSDWYYVTLRDCEMDGLEKRFCIYCNWSELRDISTDGHNYILSINKTATHFEKGYLSYTCSACGDSYTEDIAKLEEHTYTSAVTKEPTHLEEGVRTFSCACGDTYTEEIEKLKEHTFGDKDEKCECGFDRTEGCSCNCHKGGISGFFFKIILFFQKLFKSNQICKCGIKHY